MQPRIHYPGRISFKIEGEIKNVSSRPKLKNREIQRPFLMKNRIGSSKLKKKGRCIWMKGITSGK